MKKVQATAEFKKIGKAPHELRRVPEPNEIFTVSDERYFYLAGNNPYGKIFVKLASDNVSEFALDMVKSVTSTNRTGKVSTIPTKKTTPVVLAEENPEIYIIEPDKDIVKTTYNEYVELMNVSQEEVVEEVKQPKKRGRKKKEVIE